MDKRDQLLEELEQRRFEIEAYYRHPNDPHGFFQVHSCPECGDVRECDDEFCELISVVPCRACWPAMYP